MTLATKVARDAATVTQGDIDSLRNAGFTDAGIFDVVAAAAWRCFFAKMPDALGARPDVNLFVKLEAFNPMGSVKDRLALGVIEAAEKRRRAQARPDRGRGHQRQYRHRARHGLRAEGLSAGGRDGGELQRRAAPADALPRRQGGAHPGLGEGQRHAGQGGGAGRDHGWFLCRQFENEANADVHSRTTAREILNDFRDAPLDYWVTGAGTGGTLKGVARVLKKQSPGTRIVVCEPDNAPVLASGIRQARDADGAPSESHPHFRPHPMQGWSPDFIPRLVEDAVDAGLIDRSFRSRAATRCGWRANWRSGRASSPASPAARRSPARCKSRAGAGRRQHPVHAAGHRRALSQHAAVRGRFRRHERRRRLRSRNRLRAIASTPSPRRRPPRRRPARRSGFRRKRTPSSAR
jgi:cysteine synthase